METKQEALSPLHAREARLEIRGRGSKGWLTMGVLVMTLSMKSCHSLIGFTLFF